MTPAGTSETISEDQFDRHEWQLRGLSRPSGSKKAFANKMPTPVD